MAPAPAAPQALAPEPAKPHQTQQQRGALLASNGRSQSRFLHTVPEPRFVASSQGLWLHHLSGTSGALPNVALVFTSQFCHCWPSLVQPPTIHQSILLPPAPFHIPIFPEDGPPFQNCRIGIGREEKKVSGARRLRTRRGYVRAALLLELVDQSFQGLDGLGQGVDEGDEVGR